MIALEDSDAAISAVGTLGFRVSEDERPTRLVLADHRDRRIDFHTVRFDDEGGGNQTLQEGRVYRYPPEGFEGHGIIGGREVPCLTGEVQIECRVGYDPDENDFHDMRLLRDRLGATIPPAFD